jgi:hypothetical protein
MEASDSNIVVASNCNPFVTLDASNHTLICRALNVVVMAGGVDLLSSFIVVVLVVRDGIIKQTTVCFDR